METAQQEFLTTNFMTPNIQISNFENSNFKKENLYLNKTLISPLIATSADLRMAHLPTQLQITTADLTNTNKYPINCEKVSKQEILNNIKTTAITTSNSFNTSNSQLGNLLMNNQQTISMLINSNQNTSFQNSLLKDVLTQPQTSVQQQTPNGLLSNNQLQNNLLPIIQVNFYKKC